MIKREIYITEFDKKRLEELISVARAFSSYEEEYLKELEEELKKGKVVDSVKVPKDVITMNSQVRIKDIDSNEEFVYTLVFPGMADIDQNKISIISPVGTALLGYREGDTVEWKVPAGIRRLSILDILYQPEAAGDYNL
ncbi:MAG: nucleoside diphosphate kinase regulator [Candidatus Aureabacteria bacterium]|nr:nucleoside diphosphate kinase regulator [Candidatus Auribacterota bacterium]